MSAALAPASFPSPTRSRRTRSSAPTPLLAGTALDGISNAKIVEVPELFRDPTPRELARHLGAGG